MTNAISLFVLSFAQCDLKFQRRLWYHIIFNAVSGEDAKGHIFLRFRPILF